jgi:hypothetical protein
VRQGLGKTSPTLQSNVGAERIAASFAAFFQGAYKRIENAFVPDRHK